MTDHELKIKAGLVPTGYDQDGHKEYIGTDANWDRYEELKDKEEALRWASGIPF